MPLRLQFLRGAVLVLAWLCLARAQAASVEMKDGQSHHGALQFGADGTLTIQPTAGNAVIVPWTNVARATFAPGPFLSSGSVLPNGWTLQDFGDVRGSTRLHDDLFTLRADGGSTNASAFHFASRVMASDGEISARIEQVSGGASTRAGLMIRSLNNSPLAALACDGAGRVWFERRPDTDRKEFRSTIVSKLVPPVWLRLHKRDKTITASVSSDGRSWQNVGTDSIKLLPEKTWREHEGETHQLRAAVGVFIASRAQGVSATAQVRGVALTQHGLLGEYFAGREFKERAFTRLDPQLSYTWSSAPESLFGQRDFSVRWTGQLVPRKSGDVVFYLEGEAMPRLWIDGREIEPRPFKRPEKKSAPLPPARPLAIVAGHAMEVKLEFRAGDSRPSVKLGWAAPGSDKPEIIGLTNFICSFYATNSPEPILAGLRTNNSPRMRGVLLRNGTFIAGGVAAADESAVRLTLAGRADTSVLNSRVARIYLRPPRQPLPYQTTAGRTGAFLRDGDFSEGEFRGIEHGRVGVNSVLFGLRRYWIENGDVLAVILNDPAPITTDFEVRLLDGSIFQATKFSANERVITIQEPLLGSLSFPAADLCEIRRVPESVRGSRAAALR